MNGNDKILVIFSIAVVGLLYIENKKADALAENYKKSLLRKVFLG